MTVHDAILLDTLALNSRSSLEPLRVAVAAALATGARPFEVVVGAPYERYGARLTFAPRPGGASRLAATLAIEDHPWGPPSWVGVRWVDGRLAVKPYHRIARVPEGFEMPSGVEDELLPRIAALDGDRLEVYFQSMRERSWRSFVISSLAPLCGRPRAEAIAEAARPRPRPALDNHAVSYCLQRGALQAISVFANGRALPDEHTVRAAWVEGLVPDDATRYERLVAAVCAYGRNRRGATNAMLSWTILASGAEQRAVSLAIPVRTG